MYSRKIIHHKVHEKQSDTLAANFLKAAVHKENFEWEEVQGEKGRNLIKLKNKLILHSDNGAPMKGKNMLYQCYELGVQTHYSRPRQSNVMIMPILSLHLRFWSIATLCPYQRALEPLRKRAHGVKILYLV